MAKSSSFHLIISAMLISAFMVVSIKASSEQEYYTWMQPMKNKASCHGSIAECMASGEEFDMDSEINRRILATSNYISYGALQRNTIPCSQRGASYYNCRPGAEANPYNRGCNAITRCRS